MNIGIFSPKLQSIELNQLDLILALIEKGHNPIVYVVNDDSQSELFNKIKVKVVNIDFLETDICRLRSFKTINRLADIFEADSIDLLISSSATPCIYGALAGKRAGVKAIYSQFTDIGRLFQTNKKFRKFYIKLLCKLTAKRSDKVIFHNMDNMMFFVSKKLIKSDKAINLGGHGINTEEYTKSEYTHSRTFLLAAPLAVDKGIWEYIQAAGIIKQLNKNCTFKLLVKNDDSPYAIERADLLPYVEKGYIDIFDNYDDDIENMMEEAFCYVIPSYHESMPFELLLAMAKGRPVIATDVPGCRDAVLDGINGYVVPPQNVEVMVQRMLQLLADEETATQMAQESYTICSQKYDAYDVVDRLINVIFGSAEMKSND
ncbi:MAG: glycosyltransferase [Eubacteriales bacterium]|nr:glycosyltransferase [Eubacteriales bacterium]